MRRRNRGLRIRGPTVIKGRRRICRRSSAPGFVETMGGGGSSSSRGRRRRRGMRCLHGMRYALHGRRGRSSGIRERLFLVFRGHNVHIECLLIRSSRLRGHDDVVVVVGASGSRESVLKTRNVRGVSRLKTKPVIITRRISISAETRVRVDIEQLLFFIFYFLFLFFYQWRFWRSRKTDQVGREAKYVLGLASQVSSQTDNSMNR